MDPTEALLSAARGRRARRGDRSRAPPRDGRRPGGPRDRDSGRPLAGTARPGGRRHRPPGARGGAPAPGGDRRSLQRRAARRGRRAAVTARRTADLHPAPVDQLGDPRAGSPGRPRRALRPSAGRLSVPRRAAVHPLGAAHPPVRRQHGDRPSGPGRHAAAHAVLAPVRPLGPRALRWRPRPAAPHPHDARRAGGRPAPDGHHRADRAGPAGHHPPSGERLAVVRRSPRRAGRQERAAARGSRRQGRRRSHARRPLHRPRLVDHRSARRHDGRRRRRSDDADAHPAVFRQAVDRHLVRPGGRGRHAPDRRPRPHARRAP